MNAGRLFGLAHLTMFPLTFIMMGLPLTDQTRAALAIPVMVLAVVFVVAVLQLHHQMSTADGLKAFLAQRGFGRTTLYLELVIGCLLIPWLLSVFSASVGLRVFLSNALIVLSFVAGAILLIQSFRGPLPPTSPPTT